MQATFTRTTDGRYIPSNLVPLVIAKDGREWRLSVVIHETKPTIASFSASFDPVRERATFTERTEHLVLTFPTLRDAKFYALPLIRHPQGVAVAETFAAMSAKLLQTVGHGRRERIMQARTALVLAWGMQDETGEASMCLMPAKPGGDFCYFVKPEAIPARLPRTAAELDREAEETHLADVMVNGRLAVVDAAGAVLAVYGDEETAKSEGAARARKQDGTRLARVYWTADGWKLPEDAKPEPWTNLDLLGRPKPEPTSPENAGERMALGSLIAELAHDDYVTTTEAAQVLAWCREWASDCVWSDVTTRDFDNMPADQVLRSSHTRIVGGLAFVLADVRRIANDARQGIDRACPACKQGLSWDGHTQHSPGCPDGPEDDAEPCDCGTVTSPSGAYVLHAPGAHEDCTGLSLGLAPIEHIPGRCDYCGRDCGDVDSAPCGACGGYDLRAEPAKPEQAPGLTVSVLARIVDTASRDHEGGPFGSLAPEACIIHAVSTDGDLDSSFDRVSFARWHEETFEHEGSTYRVQDFYGKPWRIANVATQETRTDVSEAELAKLLTDANGPHPDPYIGTVDVTYDRAGHRALYGVRASGAFECWQD